MKLSAKNADGLRLPPGKRDHIEFDDAIPGFGLRIRDGGSRTWIYQYSLGSKQRRVVIGKASALTPDKARNLAADLHAKVRLGGDPAAERAVNQAQAANSFGELVRQYLAFQERELRPRSYVEVRRHLEKNAKQLHGLPVSSIDLRTVADRLNRLATEKGTVTANRARATLSALFAWAMRQGLATSNPVANTEKRAEQSRSRVLSDDELRAIWLALDDDDYGAIVALLMLTGCRASEIGGLRWSEVLEDRIDLGAARTKNGRPHFIPLSSVAQQVLATRPRRLRANGSPSEFVFGANGPFGGWGLAKARLDAKLAFAEPWVIHDLRRTFVTKLADDLKIPPHVIEVAINHVSGHKGGVAGIYNKATYLNERKQALDLWGEHLLAIVAGRKRNILPMRR